MRDDHTRPGYISCHHGEDSSCAYQLTADEDDGGEEPEEEEGEADPYDLIRGSRMPLLEGMEYAVP